MLTACKFSKSFNHHSGFTRPMGLPSTKIGALITLELNQRV